MKYEYFDKEGAIFRKRAGRSVLVDEIKRGGKWVPYDGDRMAPVFHGDVISAKEAGEYEHHEGLKQAAE